MSFLQIEMPHPVEYFQRILARRIPDDGSHILSRNPQTFDFTPGRSTLLRGASFQPCRKDTVDHKVFRYLNAIQFPIALPLCGLVVEKSSCNAAEYSFQTYCLLIYHGRSKQKSKQNFGVSVDQQHCRDMGLKSSAP